MENNVSVYKCVDTKLKFTNDSGLICDMNSEHYMLLARMFSVGVYPVSMETRNDSQCK